MQVLRKLVFKANWTIFNYISMKTSCMSMW
jgi:hypothetical protein